MQLYGGHRMQQWWLYGAAALTGILLALLVLPLPYTGASFSSKVVAAPVQAPPAPPPDIAPPEEAPKDRAWERHI